MPTAVVCPNCRASIEIASDVAANEPIRCKQCVHTFLRGDGQSAGFQAGPAPLTVTPINDHDLREDVHHPPRRPTARPVVTMTAFLWLALGVLFLLLTVSLGFNVWVFVGGGERRHHFDDVIRAEREAMVARDMAQQARANAEQMEVQAKVKAEQLKRQHDEMTRQLKQVEEQLEEARRQLKKDPEREGCFRREPPPIAALMAGLDR